jgi:hypothetical protein
MSAAVTTGLSLKQLYCTSSFDLRWYQLIIDDQLTNPSAS